MTPDEKYEIATLASDLEAKRLRYQALSITNTYGLDAEASERLTINYRIAQTEYLEAVARLNSAQKRIAFGKGGVA